MFTKTRSTRLESSYHQRTKRSHRRTRCRRLIEETLEPRLLLATLSGVKFNDINGNGQRAIGIQGVDPHVVFVIDISGSTDSDEPPTPSTFQGTPVGDRNADGNENDIIDAEIAAFDALNTQLDALVNSLGGTLNSATVSIVSFSTDAQTELTSSPPNAAVVTALESLQGEGQTNYEAALTEALNVLTTENVLPINANVVFLSDGFPFITQPGTEIEIPQNIQDEVNALNNFGANVRAFGVGDGARLDDLLIIDSEAVIFRDTDSLTRAFQAVDVGSIGEPGLAGVTIFLDLNNNGDPDTGELTTVTAADGSWSFPNAPIGSYTVREIVPAGSTPTTLPVPVTVGDGTNQTGIEFGNFENILISGTKFLDQNANGIRDTGEPGLEGVTILLDLDGDLTADDSTTTDSDGRFSFANIGPSAVDTNGTSIPIVVAEIVPSGFVQTAPATVAYSFVPLSGAPRPDLDFGNAAEIGEVDFGDAPDSSSGEYPTLLSPGDGARHAIVAGGPFLGNAQPDADADGQPTSGADGDDSDGNDDEDGFDITDEVAVAGKGFPSSTLSFDGGNAGAIINAWIDWNRDGTWDDPGEQILTDFSIAAGAGSVNLADQSIPVPTDLDPGTTFARFRVSSFSGTGPSGIGPTGFLADGEIEDHPLETCGFVVTSTDDGIDPNDRVNTLREAILCANDSPGLDTISFAIPGTGPHTIQVGASGLGALPDITDPVIIDGYSQSGSSANTNPVGQGLVTMLRVEVDVSAGGAGASGLVLRPDSAGSTVRGLAINGYSNVGVFIIEGGGHTIEGNFIGTSVDGNAPGGNASADGISIVDSPNNTVGGTTPAARNLISANSRGLGIFNAPSINNRVQGNLIGTDAAGTADLGNALFGIHVFGAFDTTIGGTISGAGNLVSGNDSRGVNLSRGSSRSVVQGNFIGTRADGTGDLGNTRDGVRILDSTDNAIGGSPGAANVIGGNDENGVLIEETTALGNVIAGNFIGTDSTKTLDLGNTLSGIASIGSGANLIGGLNPDDGNTIAFNGGDGVVVGASITGDLSTMKAIVGNDIYFNDGLGINLVGGDDEGTIGNNQPNDVTPNDPAQDKDADVGANNLQNFPVLSSATTDGSSVTVTGTINSSEFTPLLIEFFANDAQDPSEFGEGQRFMGRMMVMTDTDGNADIDVTLTPTPTVAAGQFITSTATLLQPIEALQLAEGEDLRDFVLIETSEFSRAIPVTGTAIVADLSLTKGVSSPTALVNQVVTFTITLNNAGPNTASGVTVLDVLPSGLQVVDSPILSVGTYNPGTGVWNVGTLANDATATLNVMVTSSTAQTFNNVARVETSAEADPDSTPGNNVPSEDDQDDAAVTFAAPQQADLSLAKSVSSPTALVNQVVTFTITLNNAGPNAASGVTVLDVLPSGLQVVDSPIPSVGTYNPDTGVWNVGTLANGATETLNINVTSATAQTFNNVARVETSTEADPDSTPGNNVPSEDDQDDAAVTFAAPQQADLSLAKSVSSPTALVNQVVTFTITLNNAGPNAASGVTVLDVLPSGLQVVDSPILSVGTYNPGTGVWNVGTLANDATATLNVMVTSSTAQTFNNVARVETSAEADPDSTPGNNVPSEDDQDDAAVTFAAPQQADLSLAKSVSSPTALVNQVVTFTITLNNAGPNTASGVTVLDVLPSGLQVVDSPIPSVGTYNPGTGVWNVGTLANDATATLNVMVTSSTAQTFNNVARVETSAEADPDSTPGNNVPSEDDQDDAAVTFAAPQQADLSLAKSVSSPTALVNQVVTFTITLNNAGPNTASGVTVLDVLPSGLQVVDSPIPSVGTYNPDTGVWNVGTLANGATETLNISVTSATAQQFNNVARVETSTVADPDSTPGNNVPAEDDQDDATVTFEAPTGSDNSFSGVVYLDANNNGIRDPQEIALPNVPVTISGPVNQTVTSGPDGAYAFFGLPSGAYRVEETQPSAFVDGIDTRGNPTLGALENDAFIDVVLFGGVNATNYNFAERGLDAPFVSKVLLLASTPPMDQLIGQLVAQGGLGNLLPVSTQSDATVQFSAEGENTRLELYSANMLPVAIGAEGESLSASVLAGETYLLTIPGNDASTIVDVRQTILADPTRTNPDNPLDANVDGRISALDALTVINGLGDQSINGALDGASPFYLDVNRDNRISALDALVIIEGLREQFSPSSVASAEQVSAISQSSDDDASDDDVATDNAGMVTTRSSVASRSFLASQASQTTARSSVLVSDANDADESDGSTDLLDTLAADVNAVWNRLS